MWHVARFVIPARKLRRQAFVIIKRKRKMFEAFIEGIADNLAAPVCTGPGSLDTGLSYAASGRTYC